jgi:hypothetical protein
MRFQENDDPSKWAPRPTLKSRAHDGDVLHHNTLNATAPSHDEEARSREVERFFDLMTSSTAAGMRR